MGTVKSLSDLLEVLLLDCGRKCGVDVSRDIQTLRRRSEHEGDSFVTIALAAYAQEFDRLLDDGSVTPGSFPGFHLGRSGIPEFLRGFLRRVFDPTKGALRRSPDIEAIRAVRQICRFGTKVNLACSEKRVNAAVEGYISVDETCRGFFQELPSHLREDGDEEPEPPWWRSPNGEYYKAVASVITGAMILEDEDGNVPVHCIHGPGATVEGYTPNGKWTFGYWHTRLEEAGLTWQRACFGAEKPLWGEVRVGFQPVYVDPADEALAKVVLVPKTLKSPRVIAVEPCAMQFAQQGLAAVLRTAIDHCRLTAGRINFRDQTVNQEKALRGSVLGENIATIDLKDASDRVDCSLVHGMFRGAPSSFFGLLWASRTTRAKLPDGREVDLRKFASMGSALCFPVESLVFFTLVIAARLRAKGLPVTRETVERTGTEVAVYGDDLCVPADEAPMICSFLEAFGLKVNYRKSFWTGQFRESCGVDAYAGERVTPVYLRKLPTDHADASQLVSLVATGNLLFLGGYPRVADVLRKHVELNLGPLPEVPEDSGALGWAWHSHHSPRRRWSKRYQKWEYHCWVARPVLQQDPIDGDAAWAKCCRRIKGSALPSARTPLGSFYGVPREVLDRRAHMNNAAGHLDESARPHALALKREWVDI